jgi:hypothetical protein
MKHTYAGEVQFKRYADTSTQGQTITLTLPDRESLEAFIGLEGKRFQAVFVLVGDDEQPAEPPPKAVKVRERLGPICEWAVLRCKEEPFLRFMAEQTRIHPDHFLEADAKLTIYSVCGITSRKELDTDEHAADVFTNRFMVPYRKWIEKHGVTA